MPSFGLSKDGKLPFKPLQPVARKIPTTSMTLEEHCLRQEVVPWFVFGGTGGKFTFRDWPSATDGMVCTFLPAQRSLQTPARDEAAHIRSVEANGPDVVSNGLALSGTAHWMFDRGLIGLDDNLQILVSRQANDRDSIRGVINKSGRLLIPPREADRPHKQFVRWHREHCFKH